MAKSKYKELKERQEENEIRFIAYALSCYQEFDRETFLNYQKENVRAVKRLPREEIKRILSSTVETLPIEERDVIKLRYRLGGDRYAYSYDDLANIFNTNRIEIITRKMRAIAKIKPVIEAMVSLN